MLTRLFALIVAASIILTHQVFASQNLIVGHFTNYNYSPFGTAPFNLGPEFPSTRYQQVYAASNFQGVSTITAILFFDSGVFDRVVTNIFLGNVDYSISFSVSKFRVDNLDEVNLDNNPGDNAKLFANIHLSGQFFNPVLTITGDDPFVYDPSKGDLLIDMKRTSLDSNAYYTGLWEAMGGQYGTAEGLFSRASDFSLGTKGYGLVTGFTIVPEPATLALLTLGGIIAFAARRR